MEPNSFPVKPEQILEIVLKKRWFILIPFLISLIVGCHLAIVLPKVYQSRTSILVQPQRVPGSFVKSIISSNISSRISTISQQILSSSNLEKIINQFQLFSGENQENMFLEDKVNNLRKRIHINLTRAQGGASAFTISYRGNPPEKVMQVANTLATFFMDENLKIREAQAIGTSDFLDSELEKTQKKLEAHEKAISTYRIKHLGGLPEELNSNLSSLDRLQEELNSKQEALINTRRMFQMAQASEKNTFITIPGEGQVALSENEHNLLQAKKALEGLLIKYTPRHPDVIKLSIMVKNLQQKITDDRNPQTKTEGQGESQTSSDLRESAQESQATQLREQIKRLQSDIINTQKKMILYQQRVDNTPKREQEILSLNRDYGNIRSVYSSLLSRKLEAEIAVNMEKKQKGEQFRILDYARIPNKPISPDIKKIMIGSIVIGLGIGCGIVFLLEILNTSLRGSEDIESFLGITVLATIPVIKHPGDLKKRKINLFLSLVAILVSVFFVGCLALFTIKGVDQTMTSVKNRIRIVEKLTLKN